MIGHETIRPHLDFGVARLLSQQISINLLVGVLQKDRLPTIRDLSKEIALSTILMRLLSPDGLLGRSSRGLYGRGGIIPDHRALPEI
jgi:hypothetical protein